MKSLQNKILLFFVLLLLMVQSIAWWTLMAGKAHQEAQEINHQLTTAKTIFSELFERRSEYLAVFAETVAKDHGIKAVFEEVFEQDNSSFLVALNNHRKRIDADLAMAISAQKIIAGQLVVEFAPDGSSKVRQGKERRQRFRYADWLESKPGKAKDLRAHQAYLYQIDDALYQLSLSPVAVGSNTIGWLAFGFQIDRRLAQEFTQITGLQTDFIVKDPDGWSMVASSREDADLAFAQAIVGGKTPAKYIALGHQVSGFAGQQLGVALYGLRAAFVEVLQQSWLPLLLLAVITLLLSLAGAYWIAASISKPVTRLVRLAKIVAGGDYHQRVKMNEQNELGQLANEFNLMQSALLSREQALLHRANHDPLTDLLNRNGLKNVLGQRVGEDGRPFALFYLNLSRLKDVNDALGHDVGDRVLICGGKRLLRADNFQQVCHLGGGEFILLSELDQTNGIEANIETLVSDVNQQLEAPFDYQNLNLHLQVRIGIVLFPEHGSDPATLLKMADTALHHTRKTRKQVQLYHPDLDVDVERLTLINDLKQAIIGGQLVLFYQPQLNLANDTINHVEALVRWQHPQLGMIPPDSFISIAEQTGQIDALTQWVLTTAIEQHKQWKDEGIDMTIAVNLSAENLKDPDFYAFVCGALQAAQVPAEKILLEVTESAVVEDPQTAIVLLSAFKDHGMKISIDDYGTGYSSLEQLKQLPVHELKIDKSFIQHLNEDKNDQIIVRSTIALAHDLGLSIVAEGIEDEAAMLWLADLGCELGQGYFISRPQPAATLTQWLKQRAKPTTNNNTQGAADE